MTAPFETITIGPIQLKNRLVMAPMKTALGTTEGLITDQLISFFRKRADGGIGLIISEPMAVVARGREHPKQIIIDNDTVIPQMSRLTEVIHAADCHIFAHLNHGGRAANPKASGSPPESPGPIPCPRTGVEPEVLTESRIAELVDAFGLAAKRAKKAGFDGIELQFGLGYLVSQFLSPSVNTRTDHYGGNLENRLRFAREVFQAVRYAVGNDFPIGVRISGSEKIPKGLDLEDALHLAQQCEVWGVDMIHVATGSNCESLPWYFQHMSLPTGVNESLAAQIKGCVDKPIMAAGRLGDPKRIREVLATNMIDLVAIGRGLLADPELANKMARDEDEKVLLCGHCLQGCFGNVKTGKSIGCNINPTVSYDDTAPTKPEFVKHIVVIGGGPAGIQAALTAWQRGHRVTLFEKNGSLGGQFDLAHRLPHKQRMIYSLQSFISQLQFSDVEVLLNEAATFEKLQQLSPDLVIIATGSEPIMPDIEGVIEPLTDAEVITGQVSIGQRILILGGGMIGLELAELFADQGKEIVVVEKLSEVARDMNPISKKLLLKRLSSLPVKINTNTELLSFINNEASVNVNGETKNLGKFDDIIVSIGHKSYENLSEQLMKSGFTVHVIGDAQKPAKIIDAVTAGYKIAMAI